MTCVVRASHYIFKHHHPLNGDLFRREGNYFGDILVGYLSNKENIENMDYMDNMDNSVTMESSQSTNQMVR